MNDYSARDSWFSMMLETSVRWCVAPSKRAPPLNINKNKKSKNRGLLLPQSKCHFQNGRITSKCLISDNTLREALGMPIITLALDSTRRRIRFNRSIIEFQFLTIFDALKPNSLDWVVVEISSELWQ
jgi:hypothetical protein